MCDNVLQPEPRSSEGCNTLSHEGLANVNTENNVLSSLLYTFPFSTPDLNGNEALCCRVLMGMKPGASDWTTISCIATALNVQLSAVETRQVSIVNTY